MYKKAWQSIEGADSILLISHVRPDGDTLGSILALYSLLRARKKRVFMYNPSANMPRRLGFMPNIHKISQDISGDFDVAVACDCASLERLGLGKGNFTLINLDHHDTNDNFGDININEPDFPSATMVVYNLLQKNDIVLSQEIALCLYVGFVEDTGFFTYGNLNQNALEMVLEISKTGVNLAEVGLKLRQEIPLSLFRLRQHVYDAFYLVERANIGIVTISCDDLKRTGCKLSDTKNIINIVLELAVVRMAIMIVQKEDGGSKVSLRSKAGVDVGKIAKTFGGGGHRRSSGFDMEHFECEKIIEKIIIEYRK